MQPQEIIGYLHIKNPMQIVMCRMGFDEHEIVKTGMSVKVKGNFDVGI